MNKLLEGYLAAEEPEVRYKAHRLTGCFKSDDEEKSMRDSLRTSQIVQKLLSEVGPDGKIPYHPYKKWYGAHWVLAMLAELDYPPNDPRLVPLRDQQMDEFLLSPHHRATIHARQGRIRRCASQEGYAIYAQWKLGLANERTEQLVHDLIAWQWPDGGWNCDKNPDASHSSFHETLQPFRALAIWAQFSGDPKAAQAAERASEVFLKRHLLWSASTGAWINNQFNALAFPWYWHYGLLAGLHVLMQAGYLNDPRCQRALDFLEEKRLPDGGFPLERSYIRAYREPRTTGISLADFGPVGRRRSHPLVTIFASEVLKAAGRLD